MLCCGVWKPKRLALSRSLSLIYLWTIFRITFLKSVRVMDRFSGCKFWRNSGPLPGFSKVMTFASFQDFGKCDGQRQRLHKCVRCTSGLLGRYQQFHRPLSISVNLLWDVDVRSNNHIHYNKYLSSLEYHSRLGKLSVPEEHQRKLLL
jgi:hypothetical protein